MDSIAPRATPIPPVPSARAAFNTGQFATHTGSDPDLEEVDPTQALRIAKRGLRIGKEVRQSVGRPAGTNSDGTPYEATGMWKHVVDGFATVERQLGEIGPKLDKALDFIETTKTTRASRGRDAKDIGMSVIKGLLLIILGGGLTALWRGIH